MGRIKVDGAEYQYDVTYLMRIASDGIGESVSEETERRVRARIKARDARKARDQVLRDCGLVKVRGALGGTYWE